MMKLMLMLMLMRMATMRRMTIIRSKREVNRWIQEGDPDHDEADVDADIDGDGDDEEDNDGKIKKGGEQIHILTFLAALLDKERPASK